ncbi:neurotrimin-like [Amphiura filiformis]|uniref:neurotrimin-like n=1 Tax=Amphiura filiformis TaxID=82378 RepID=UPI003B227125
MYLAFILALLAPSAWAVGDGTVQFLNQPRDQIVRAGETVTMYCSVSNGENGRFMWVRDGQVISQGYTIAVEQEPHRFTIQGIDGNYNLRIVNAKTEDSGSYRCMVTSGGSGIMSNLGRLVVESPPAQEYPTCQSSESNQVAVGETVTVTCTVHGGNPASQLTILKDNVALQGESIIDGTSYQWNVLEEDDGAQFSCVGTHVFWTDPRTCRLGPYRVISEPPTALLVPRLMETIAGGAASFVCSASSAPRAHYRWFIDETEIFDGSENSRFTIEHTAVASILQIHSVFEQDAGRVLCYVDAATGTIVASSDLEVRPYVVVPVIPDDDTDLPITGPPQVPDDTDSSEDAQPDPAPPKSDEAPKAYNTAKLPIILGSVGAGILVISLVILGSVLFAVKVYQDRRSGKASPSQQVDPQEDDVMYRSRYVSVVRSWLFPVHQSTQAGVAAFGIDNPNATTKNATLDE